MTRVPCIAIAALCTAIACDRPKVREVPVEAPPPGDAAPIPIDDDGARALISSVAVARSGADPRAIAVLYQPDARILSWRGSSSWTYHPPDWAELLAERKATVTPVAIDVVRFAALTRVVAVFDEVHGSDRQRVLSLYEVIQREGQWSIAAESELERINLDAAPLSGYSAPVFANLSYRATPEIAILRLSGRAPSRPELGWDGVQKTPCPGAGCEAELQIDLLTFTPSGDKSVDTHLDSYRGPCTDVPAVQLLGALQVFEREALVVQKSGMTCASDDGWRTVGIYGVRGVTSARLLALERSRVKSVDEDSVTIEHRPDPAAPPQEIRFVPEKQQSELVFRAEPPPKPKTAPGPK